MLPLDHNNPPDAPALVFLHFLGGSSKEWSGVVARLEPRFRCTAIDLPGFGNAVDIAGYTVGDMADYVVRMVEAAALQRWVLIGHSMGAKVAAAIARRAEDGAPGLRGLQHLVLVAGSPPGPEPMDAAQRASMMAWFADDAETSRQQAMRYIADNTSTALEQGMADQAVEDVLRMNINAWRAWLNAGSREDWTTRIGVLRIPTLILAGSDDQALGPDTQQSLTVTHFEHPHLETLAGAGHLLPMERPDDVAHLIATHVFRPPPTIPPHYRALIESDRVSANTRAVLLAREAAPMRVHRPAVLTACELETLRAMTDRVMPQAGSAYLDIASHIDMTCAAGTGDGWRFDALPPDAQAYRAGIASIDFVAHRTHGCSFARLEASAQDRLLQCAADGLWPAACSSTGLLDALQMRLWFEDLRAATIRYFVSHPATMAAISYSGIAYGGDAARKPGFSQLGLDAREDWEPVTQA